MQLPHPQLFYAAGLRKLEAAGKFWQSPGSAQCWREGGNGGGRRGGMAKALSWLHVMLWGRAESAPAWGPAALGTGSSGSVLRGTLLPCWRPLSQSSTPGRAEHPLASGAALHSRIRPEQFGVIVQCLEHSAQGPSSACGCSPRDLLLGQDLGHPKHPAPAGGTGLGELQPHGPA